MKIWNTYGSEHSMNLVMIGSFKDVASAEEAKAAIDQVTEFVRDQPDRSLEGSERYSPELMDLVMSLKIHTIAPHEFEQFSYDHRWKVEGNLVKLTTDEADVSAILKLLIDMGAKVEIYSAHDYPNTGEGR